MHRIEQATDKLIKAYLTGTLVHGEACSCAVGNLCNGNPDWTLGFDEELVSPINVQEYHSEENVVHHHRAMRNNPYNKYDTIKIENAFEGRDKTAGNFATLNEDNDPDSFIGLTNVFDALEIIDADYFADMESKVIITQIVNTGIMPIGEMA